MSGSKKDFQGAYSKLGHLFLQKAIWERFNAGREKRNHVGHGERCWRELTRCKVGTGKPPWLFKDQQQARKMHDMLFTRAILPSKRGLCRSWRAGDDVDMGMMGWVNENPKMRFFETRLVEQN